MLTRCAEIFNAIRPALAAIDAATVDKLLERILSTRQIFLLGAGQTGLVLRMLAMRLTQMGLQAKIPGECTTPAIRKDDLLLVASSSGERPGILTLTTTAKTEGAKITLITASPQSALAKLADQRLFLPNNLETNKNSRLLLGTGFELSLQMFCIVLVEMLARRLEQDEAALRQRHANLE